MSDAVNIDQILSITKELATVQAIQQTTLEEIRSLKSTLSSQYMPRLEAEEKFRAQGIQIEEIKNSKKHNHSMIVSYVSAVGAIGLFIATLFTLLHK